MLGPEDDSENTSEEQDPGGIDKRGLRGHGCGHRTRDERSHRRRRETDVKRHAVVKSAQNFRVNSSH